MNKNIGVMLVEVVKALDAHGLALETLVITLRDTDILHALRDRKASSLPLDMWRDMAEYINMPQAVLLDTTQKDNALLYIIDLGDERGKVIIKLDYTTKVRDEETGKRIRTALNIIRSGTPVSALIAAG